MPTVDANVDAPLTETVLRNVEAPVTLTALPRPTVELRLMFPPTVKEPDTSAEPFTWRSVDGVAVLIPTRLLTESTTRAFPPVFRSVLRVMDCACNAPDGVSLRPLVMSPAGDMYSELP
eukprot:44109-Eustigmatos_ZCMA.PRE.1